LGPRDLDVLEHPEDVGELQPQKSNVFAVADFQDFRLRQAPSRRVELQHLRLGHTASFFSLGLQNFSVKLAKINCLSAE
jgi:hypothetical protein